MRRFAPGFFPGAQEKEEKVNEAYDIAKTSKSCYNVKYRAKRGGSGALYSQSAIARLNSHPRCGDFMVCLNGVVLTPGSCATGTHEPCQIRKEAAVSGHFCVPQGSLGRAMNLSNA